jgi:xanthine permease XanP
MPQPVIGSLMVFTASFMIAGGIQIILSRSIDSRATYVVGVSLLLGLSREIFPEYFARPMPLVHQFTGRMMSIGVVSAFFAQSGLPNWRGPQRNIRVREVGHTDR